MLRPICVLLAGLAFAGPALAGDGELCRAAVRAAETAQRLPTRLLASIALVESGRPEPLTGRVAPWPWTINVGGVGRFFASKAEAISAVRAAQAEGKASIDVGCAQVNLMHHPHAFDTLEQAFDPAANAAYAAGFLSRLHVQLGAWPAAAAAYHSSTPDRGAAYRDKVIAIWTPGARAGRTDPLSQAEREAAARRTPEFRALLAQQAADRTMLVERGIVRGPARSYARARAARVAARE